MDERLLTAYHEAAHAVVARAVGQQVMELTIKPRPASDYAPGSLGHVCLWRHPDPRPSDVWAGSGWVETQQMVSLAGYLMEDLLVDPEDETPCRNDFVPSDHREVVELLRIVLPHDVERAAESIKSLRKRCKNLLLLPGHLELVERVAKALLADETISGEDFYKRFSPHPFGSAGGACGAVHPVDPSVRCDRIPHPFDVHQSPFGDFEGFPIPPLPARRPKVTEMTGNHKRLLKLHRGGPGPHLTARWVALYDVCDELP